MKIIIEENKQTIEISDFSTINIKVLGQEEKNMEVLLYMKPKINENSSSFNPFKNVSLSDTENILETLLEKHQNVMNSYFEFIKNKRINENINSSKKQQKKIKKKYDGKEVIEYLKNNSILGKTFKTEDEIALIVKNPEALPYLQEYGIYFLDNTLTEKQVKDKLEKIVPLFSDVEQKPKILQKVFVSLKNEKLKICKKEKKKSILLWYAE